MTGTTRPRTAEPLLGSYAAKSREMNDDPSRVDEI